MYTNIWSLLWFSPKEKDNFTVAFTISPFYHGSKMLPNVQYTDARSPLTLLFTVRIKMMWTAEIQMKWRFDHRSYNRNLSNCKFKPEKKNFGFNGIRTHGLCVSAAVLYQLSYEDPYIGLLPIYGSLSPWNMYFIYSFLFLNSTSFEFE